MGGRWPHPAPRSTGTQEDFPWSSSGWKTFNLLLTALSVVLNCDYARSVKCHVHFNVAFSTILLFFIILKGTRLFPVSFSEISFSCRGFGRQMAPGSSVSGAPGDPGGPRMLWSGGLWFLLPPGFRRDTKELPHQGSHWRLRCEDL